MPPIPELKDIPELLVNGIGWSVNTIAISRGISQQPESSETGHRFILSRCGALWSHWRQGTTGDGQRADDELLA